MMREPDADTVASCWLHVSERDRAELAVGRVPESVRAQAASVAYEALQASYLANAAKPSRTLATRRRR